MYSDDGNWFTRLVCHVGGRGSGALVASLSVRRSGGVVVVTAHLCDQPARGDAPVSAAGVPLPAGQCFGYGWPASQAAVALALGIIVLASVLGTAVQSGARLPSASPAYRLIDRSTAA